MRHRLLQLLLALLSVAVAVASARRLSSLMKKDLPLYTVHNGHNFWQDPINYSPTGRSSYDPNHRCCDFDVNKKEGSVEKCANFRYLGGQPGPSDHRGFETCFGNSGSDCAGIPVLKEPAKIIEGLANTIGWDWAGKLADSVQVKTEGGIMKVPSSVGSIFHDSCCLTRPDGLFCNVYSRPYASVLQPSLNSCPCSLEWRKAVMALITGRWWYESIPVKHISDLRPTGRPLPPTNLPASFNSWTPKSSHHLMEVKATTNIRAPPGTQLDCPGVDRNCIMGFKRFKRLEDEVEEKQKVRDFHSKNSKFLEVGSRLWSRTRLHRPSLFDRVKNKLKKVGGFLKEKGKTVGRRLKHAALTVKDTVKSGLDRLKDWVLRFGKEDYIPKEPIAAGDSVYCKSGKFKSIHYRLHILRNFRRYGVCA